VVDVQFAGVELGEALLHLFEAVTDAGVIGQTQQGVLLTDGRRIANAVLEPLCVPVHKSQSLLLAQLFDVVIHIRKWHTATDYQAHRQVRPLQRLAINQLILLVVDVSEDLRQLPWLKARISKGVQGSQCRNEEVEVRVGYKVHCDLIEVHIQDALEPHRAGQTREHACDYVIHAFVRPLRLSSDFRSLCHLA
jgi:hypothetical protein